MKAKGQGRLNYLKQKFFKYKIGIIESIDKFFSKLAQFQLIIQDIKESKEPINLDMILTMINSMNIKFYTMAKYNLEDMHKPTLATTKKRLKLVKQKIKDKTNTETESGNKIFAKRKNKLLYFHYDKPRHIKIKCFK